MYFAKRLLIFLSAIFVIGIAFLFFRSRSLSNEYPELSSKDILNDTVAHVIRDGRASARVTFKSQKKYTLPWAKIKKDQSEFNLPRVVKEGDFLIKQVSSDTIILVQDNEGFTFVAGQSID
jgi:hypothetical protein